MSHQVNLRPAAQRFLRKLRDEVLTGRLVTALRELGENPRPPGCLKMAGSEGFYRVRVGEYRIIYQVHDDRLVVLVVEIGHRRDIYR